MKLLVIGNGFDQDLGLRTSYLDFYENSSFRKQKCFVPNSIETFLKEKKGTMLRWADLEESMADYVKGKKGKLHETIIEFDKYFLKNLKEEFAHYIVDNWSKMSGELYRTPPKDSLAKNIIEIQNQTHCFDKIYSFNCMPYCDLNFASNTEIENLQGVLYIHGSYGDFIFGIRKDDCTREEYSFLVKEKQDNYPFEIVDNLKTDLLLANDIVLFGHSMNRIDMVYFEYFFKNIIDNNKPKTIIFITRDCASEKLIIENIGRYAVPFESLHHSCIVEFIRTDDYIESNLDKLFSIS